MRALLALGLPLCLGCGGAEAGSGSDSGSPSEVDADASLLDQVAAEGGLACTGSAVCGSGSPCPCTWPEATTLASTGPQCLGHFIATSCGQGLVALEFVSRAIYYCYYTDSTGQLIAQVIGSPVGGASCAGPTGFQTPSDCNFVPVPCDAGATDGASE
jgi:hypothetical protein